MAQLPQESLFSSLLRITQESSLEFLLVGGNAINAYGYQRTTFDVDLAVPEPQSDAWREVLLQMGYTLYFACTFKRGQRSP